MELQPEVFIDVTPTLDTSAYSIGDVLFNPVEIPLATKYNGGKAYVVSIQAIDEDDQGQPLDVYFLHTNNNLGTINVAPNISDANARAIVGGPFKIGSGDWNDLGGNRVARIPCDNHLVYSLAGANGSTSLWMAAVTQGTPTHTASGLKFKVGLAY